MKKDYYDMNELNEIILGYDIVLRDLIDLQEEKIEILSNEKEDEEELERFMKIDQAHLLKMRGIDEKLLKFQKKNHLESKTCKEMITLLDEKERNEAEVNYDRLEMDLSLYKDKAEIVKSLLEIKDKTAEMMASLVDDEIFSGGDAGIYERSNNQDKKIQKGKKFKATRV